MGTGWCLEARRGSARKGSGNSIVIAPACSGDTSGGARPRLSPGFDSRALPLALSCLNCLARGSLAAFIRRLSSHRAHGFFAQRVMPFDVPDELRESPSGHPVVECFPSPKYRTLTHAGFHRRFAQ
jgi:hypothetical protein